MKEAIVDAISLLFIVLFMYAAVVKLIDYQKFVVQLGQSPMLTETASFVAWTIPSLELVTVVLLAIPKTRLAALYASFSLMSMFTTYIILASWFTDYVPCSCGGVLGSLGWTEHLVFNICFLVIGFIGILIVEYAGGKQLVSKRILRN